MTNLADPPTARVSVLGLGRMGAAMAVRLAGQGHDVVGWSRSGRTISGVRTARTASEALAAADVVLLSLFDGDACQQVIAQVQGQLSVGTVVVNTSTIAPEEAAALATTITATGASYLHAPVIGSVPKVETGTLTILGGSDYDGTVASVLADLGTVLPCEGPESAASAKLVANGALASSLLAIRDSRARATELDIDAALAWTVLESTPLGGLVGSKRSRLDGGVFGQADFTVGALAKDLALLAGRAPSAVPVHREVAAALEDGAVKPDDDIAALCVTAP